MTNRQVIVLIDKNVFPVSVFMLMHFPEHVVKAQRQHCRLCFPSWKHLHQLVGQEGASQQASRRFPLFLNRCRLSYSVGTFDGFCISTLSVKPSLVTIFHYPHTITLLKSFVLCGLPFLSTVERWQLLFTEFVQMRSGYVSLRKLMFFESVSDYCRIPLCMVNVEDKHFVANLKWFGVKTSKLFTSELTSVIGLAFIVCSIRNIVVERTSSLIDGLFPNTAYNTFLQLPTSRSQTPTKYAAASGLNFQLITCWTNCYLNLSLFHAATYSLNSRSAPMKFVPLSLIIFNGLPHHAMNRIIAFRQLSVSNFRTISICPARTVRHVKRQHQRFSFLRPIFTVKCPK